jgi:hypothetical protein
MMVLVYVSHLLVSLGPFHEPNRRADPIRGIDAEYIRASDAVRSDPTVDRNAFYEVWLATFKEAAEQYPRSHHVPLARRRIIELLNGLGRYPESITLLEEELQGAKGDWNPQFPVSGRAFLYYQIGELAYSAYLAGKDRYFARKAIDSFYKVRMLTGSPNVW